MKLKLSAAEKKDLIHSIQRYLAEELEFEASELQTGFLLEYFSKELAPFAYNQGVADAQQFIAQQTEDISGSCFEEGLAFWGKAKKSRR